MIEEYIKRVKLLITKHCPDNLYSIIANFYYYIFNNSDHISINQYDNYWRIFRGNISIYSPTAKYVIPHYKLLESIWERYFRINPGDTIIDIGACLGEASIFAAIKTGPTGFVYCIEASPSNAFYLIKNVEHCNNIQVIVKAISNIKGKVAFYDNKSNLTGKAIIDNNKFQSYNNQTDKFIVVDSITLDELFGNLKRINFLKIDTQGMEYEALLGANNIMGRVEKISVKTHRSFELINNIKLFLQKNNFVYYESIDEIFAYNLKLCKDQELRI
jgi:FkbM family methyltransferase